MNSDNLKKRSAKIKLERKEEKLLKLPKGQKCWLCKKEIKGNWCWSGHYWHEKCKEEDSIKRIKKYLSKKEL